MAAGNEPVDIMLAIRELRKQGAGYLADPKGSMETNRDDILREIKDVKRLLDEMEIFLRR